MHRGDVWIVVLIVAVLLLWGWFALKKWWASHAGFRFPEGEAVGALPPEVQDLLEQQNFEIISGKLRIPIYIDADGEVLESRMFIDGLVSQDNHLYVVRIARERKPMEWTGSSIREHLLPYYLLYRQTAGILYVEPQIKSIKKIQFDIES